MPERAGTVYWIDHYTVPTSDVPRWIAFHERVLGAQPQPGRRGGPADGTFLDVGVTHHGGFGQKAPLPPPAPPGAALPRYAYFVRPEELDVHVRRLDALGVPRTPPARSSSEGEDGVGVRFVDPDGNQFEFWAPDRMPEGAMEACNGLRVGRISHVVYESRDLARTAAFFARYCALEPSTRAGIAPDTLVLPLAAGGRLVFRQVAALGARTSGRGLYRDLHTALVVREADFWPNYERVWAELPEWDYDQRIGPPPPNGEDLPARTALHGSPAGRAWKAAFGRGDDWYDWDANLFHYFVGIPHDGSMARYAGRSIESYMQDYLAARGLQAPLPVRA